MSFVVAGCGLLLALLAGILVDDAGAARPNDAGLEDLPLEQW